MTMKLGHVLCGLFTTTIVFSSLVVGSLAQVQPPPPPPQCMNELRFCIKYLNNTSQPSDSCCQPLDYVVKAIPECFCNLMSILGVNRVEQIGIDILKAQTLPERCGQRINPLQCITGTPNEQPNNSIPNSVSSRLWCSSLLIHVAASSVFLVLKAS